MVFIRATIIRNGDDSIPLTQQKIDIIRREERRIIGTDKSGLDEALRDLGYVDK